ncbi:MAG: MFS transporter [Bryobacteraceae bacterium]|jgi:OPA family sugar phosphate sensor protein UhpC-like MFS transporter
MKNPLTVAGEDQLAADRQGTDQLRKPSRVPVVSAILRYFASGPDKPPLRDPQQIERLYKRYRITVMTLITVGYGIAYMCRLGLSVVKKPLIDDGIFSADQLGTIGSAIFYAYAFGKLVNGFLADHANMKKFLAFGVLVSALINIFMGWSTVLWVWVVLWALNGWFQGFGAPAGVVAMSQWFSNRERGTYYGIWSTAHPLGEGLTFALLAAMVTWFGWRAGFVGPGVICVVLAIALYVFMEDRPQTMGLPAVADWKNDYIAKPADGAGKPKTTWQMQLSILRYPSIWVLAFSSALMTMTRYAMNDWGMLYLQEAKGYSGIAAGGLLAAKSLAGLAGCASYGFISDKLFRARRPPMNLICGVVEILSLVVMFAIPPGHPLVVTVMLLVYGFAITGLITSLGGLFAIDIAPKKAAGAAMGFIGVFSYVGAAIQERISGILIRHGTTMVNGVRQYDFHSALVFWLGTSVVSMILATSLWRVRAND